MPVISAVSMFVPKPTVKTRVPAILASCAL